MIVTRDSFESVIDTLHRYTVFSLDTETSGLHPYRQGGDRLFSIIIGTEDDEYYFNFNSKPDHTGKQIPSQYVLSRQFVKEIIAAMSDSLVFLHNAKYDMAMCAVEPFGGFLHTQAQIIHDTRSIGRVVQNNLLNYFHHLLLNFFQDKHQKGSKHPLMQRCHCDACLTLKYMFVSSNIFLFNL